MCTCVSGQSQIPCVFFNCVFYCLMKWSLSLNLEFTNQARPTGQETPESILSCLNKPQMTQLNKLHTDSSSNSFLQHNLESLLHLSEESLRSTPQASMSLPSIVLDRLSSYPVHLLSSWSSEMAPTLFTNGELQINSSDSPGLAAMA